jgi:hypothetical protein
MRQSGISARILVSAATTSAIVWVRLPGSGWVIDLIALVAVPETHGGSVDMSVNLPLAARKPMRSSTNRLRSNPPNSYSGGPAL